MRVYLNTNVVERPYDDLTEPRILEEAIAALDIFLLSHSGALAIVTSEVASAELSFTKDKGKRNLTEHTLVTVSKEIVSINDTIAALATGIMNQCKIADPMDCLHVGCAAVSNCRFFLTCDDEIIEKKDRIKSYLKYEGYTLELMNPREFVLEWK